MRPRHTLKRIHSRRWATGLLVLAPAVTAQAASTYFYVGPNGGSWNNPGNWSLTQFGSGGAGGPAPRGQGSILGTINKAVALDLSYAPPGLLVLYVTGDNFSTTLQLNQSTGTLTTGALEVI